MVEQEYWFARRFPVGHPRNAMAPVSAKAWRIVWRFVAGMAAGGVAFLLLALLAGQIILGAAVFAIAAAASGYYFISSAIRRGDQQHTVDDYKAGRVPGQEPYQGR